MKLEAGAAVSVRHYSGIRPFKSIVNEVKEDAVTLKLTREFTAAGISEGDPITVGYALEREISICSCTVVSINSKAGAIGLKIDSADTLMDKRILDRFPVSLYAEVRLKDSSKRNTITIKNLSIGGMQISSQNEFTEGQDIEINAFLDKNVVTLKAEIVWKTKNFSRFDYGLKTLYTNYNTRNYIKLYLQVLRDDEERIVKEINNL